MRLHEFLFDQLVARGVRHIFGIPGDFVLNLYEALEDDGRFRLVRLSHEPAVGFAADGAARITGGLGVCCVTYGAGGLNMINSVACAYAEESPLVVLTGGPGRIEKRADVHVHHEVKSFESQLKVYQEVTEYAAILDDPRTAAAHIRKALEVGDQGQTAGLSRNPARHGVRGHRRARDRASTSSCAVDDGARARRPRAKSSSGLTAAERPVLIVGVEVHRFQLREQVARAGRAVERPGRVVVSRPRRVSDAASAVRRHVSRRGVAAAAARDRRAAPTACCCSANSSATRASACRPSA